MSSSDDESFIRTLVDSPADNAPRLVYADWLDERGDPRGNFIHAELQWYNQAASTNATSVRQHLQSLADRLNPTWVARLSRPPVGVCCDRVRFLQSGPRLSAEDVAGAEQRVGLRFPPEFRAFLLNYNGGRPSPAYFATHGRAGDSIYFSVQDFGSLKRTRSDGLVIEIVDTTLFFRDELQMPDEWLYFAAAQVEADVLLVSANPGTFGEVHYWSHITPGFDEYQVRKVADSIPEFLGMLTSIAPPWGQLIERGDTRGFIKWLDNGGDIEIVDPLNDATPLEYAIQNCQPEIVRELFRRGATLSAHGADYYVNLASEMGNEVLLKLIEEHAG